MALFKHNQNYFFSDVFNFRHLYFPETKKDLQKLCDNESVNLGLIDTSKITDMSFLFDHSFRKDFSGIENWNVSNVRNMYNMFCFAESFNQPIGNWDVSKVTDMSHMFAHAKSFRQSLKKWKLNDKLSFVNIFDKSGMRFSYMPKKIAAFEKKLNSLLINSGREN